MEQKTSVRRGIKGFAILVLASTVALLILQHWGGPLDAMEREAVDVSQLIRPAPWLHHPAHSSIPVGLAPALPHSKIFKLAQETEKKPETKDTSPETKDTSAETKARPEELTNQACYECHNKDILQLSKEELAEQVVLDGEPKPARPRPPFAAGTLNLELKESDYAAGVHAETTCVTCHKDVVEVPHAQRLKAADCRECHDESVESVKASVHGDKLGPKAPGCIGCHDVHYGKAVSSYSKGYMKSQCIACHKANGKDTLKAHKNLYEANLHLQMDCMICHEGSKKGVHNMLPVKTKVANCESCHSKYTILSTQKKLLTGDPEYIKQTGFINGDAMKKFGYLVGANRIPALDMILILVVAGPLALPVFHGGLRILTRRKEPAELPEEKILLHPLIERIWHWVQALCIVMLIITGVIIHWPEIFPGWFHWAVTVHNWFGIACVAAFIVWLVYNLATGRISHYIPKKGDIPEGMIKQARFYGYGIFMHEPHPYAPSEDNKFNPLQKIAYLKFQVLLMPLLLVSGIIYMYPDNFKGVINAIGGMVVLGTIHLVLAALFAAFLVAHLYLATTGETIGENFKAIITGYGIKAHHDEHEEHKKS